MKNNYKLRAGIALVFLVLILAMPGLKGIPVIDRDEARYAQASVQMIETGDYINIRFQDRARNKKPVGAYWAQVLSVKIFSNVKDRQIWAHRLPSVLAALIAVLAIYWGGIKMMGRETALLGAVFLATSFLFVFEAHIAKTDALLCGFSALALAALGQLRAGAGRRASVIFWLGLGCAVLVKGPILPLIVGLCLMSLLIWERSLSWAKPLLYWPGLLLAFVIVAPWTIMIWRETGGAFFTDAFGGDLAPKLQGGHERHGGLPGYYALSIWLFFWPGSLFLLAGLGFAWRAVRNTDKTDTPIAKSCRLLLAWIVPFWIVLEIVPTKLPHYPLPIYPALALLAGAAALTLTQINTFEILRRFGAVIFMLVSIILIYVAVFAQAQFGSAPILTFIAFSLLIVVCFMATRALWNGHGRPALALSFASAIIFHVISFGLVLPSLDDLKVSGRIAQTLKAQGYAVPLAPKTALYSPHYTEPSLVYHLGTHIVLGQPEQRIRDLEFLAGDVLLVDKAREDSGILMRAILPRHKSKSLCLIEPAQISGFNYAKGDEVDIAIDIAKDCQSLSQ